MGKALILMSFTRKTKGYLTMKPIPENEVLIAVVLWLVRRRGFFFRELYTKVTKQFERTVWMGKILLMHI